MPRAVARPSEKRQSVQKAEKKVSQISEKKTSMGSDDSRRLLKRDTSGRLEELTPEAARVRLDRCVQASLEISKLTNCGTGNDIIPCDALGQTGVVLTSKQGGVPLVTGGPEWTFKRGMKPITTEVLPNDSCVIVHPGNQRFYSRNFFPPGSDYALYLDLTMSELRDRFGLHNDMEIFIVDVRTNRYHRLTLGVPLLGNSHPELSWHMRISRETLWELRSKANRSVVKSYNWSSVHSSSTVTASRTSNFLRPSEIAARTGASTKSISWGRVDVEDGTRSTMKAAEEDEPITINDTEENPQAGQAYLASIPSDAVLEFDGQAIMGFSSEDHSKRKCAVIARTDTRGIPPNVTTPEKQQEYMLVPAAHVSDPNFAAVISMEHGAAQLLLPRVHSRSAATRVLLKLPSNVVFPLLSGDVLVVRNATQDVLRVRLRVPKLSRAVPSAEAEARGEEINSAHVMKDVGLEMSYNGSPSNSGGWGVFSSVLRDPLVVHDKTVLREPKAYLFPKSFFATPTTVLHIGRAAEGEITVLDQYLSRHHATIKRSGSTMFLIEPAEKKKTIYMLIGKSDMHSRPPVALRVGDCITCGKSEFTVVFQQRGNRDLTGSAGKNGLDELLSRLDTEWNAELRVRGAPEVDPSCSTNAGESLEEIAESAESRFAKLNLNANSSGTLRQSSKSLTETEVPQFQDQRSLMDHFETQKDLQATGPLMVLLTTKGPLAKQFFSCNPVETTIGSSFFATITVHNDKRMSPYNTRVYFDKDLQRWMLEDMQSLHGTFLKVTEPTLLSTGDVFVMGTTLMRVFGQQPQTQQNRCMTS